MNREAFKSPINVFLKKNLFVHNTTDREHLPNEQFIYAGFTDWPW